MIIKHPDIDNLAKSIVTSHRTKICRSSVVEKKDEKCCLFHEFEMVMKKKLWKIKMGLKNWILFRRNKNGDWNLISVVLMTMLSRLKSLPLARDDLRKWNLYQLQKEQVSHERGFYFIHLFGGLGEIRTKRWYVNIHFERNKPTEIKIFWEE